jgi:hypothetical protein
MRTSLTGVKLLLLLSAFCGLRSDAAHGQLGPGRQRSSNLQLVAHVPMASVTSLEIERELSRPYAYVSRGSTTGWDVIDLRDLKKPKIIYSWAIEDAELHRGRALESKYFKLNGRYYMAEGYAFQQGGPNYDLGAIIFDVTGLPDPKTVKEVARIREPEFPGGFHEHYMYKHSNGSVLLFAALLGAPDAYVYDMAQVLKGDKGLVAKIPRPTTDPKFRWAGYHDFYVAYDTQTKQDKFYGAGLNGYYVYDITDLARPALITSITGVSGMDIAHTFTPDPLGRYAVTEMEYEMAPLRIFDLKPKGDGQNFVGNINRSIGAWTPNWKNLPHNHEVRWPYVFVSGYKDGLQVLNMMDPTNPAHVAYYDTHDVPDVMGGRTGYSGGGSAWGVDVRNADGLIVISDAGSGFWAFKMEGFDGWNGHDWGMPNISSEQDWDNGPEGAPKSKPVTMLQ